MPSTRSLTFTTAMRMVHGVHRNAAVMRTLPQPSRTSCLADRNVLVIDVAHLSDRSHAVLRNFARLARGQLHERVLRFLRYQLRRSACRTHHLSALARLQFQIMNLGAW